jgi:hypothetical protein
MITVVRAIGKELNFVAPSEFTIGNMIRRILFVIREEYATKLRSLFLFPLLLHCITSHRLFSLSLAVERSPQEPPPQLK